MDFFSSQVEEEIKSTIRRMMHGVVTRRIKDEPFDPVSERLNKPFHYAVAPEIVWKASKFERSLVTSMGQIGWEQIACSIARGYHGYAETGYSVIGEVFENRLSKIHKILDELEHTRKPNWDVELDEILSETGESKAQIHVTSDLYVHNTTTNEYFYCEIKAPKPNSDQTKVSKEKMFKIKALHDTDNHKVFYALPYNPFGKREDYAHSHPKRWFDMLNDETVIMGKEFWDLLGGQGAYEALLEIFNEVGKEYQLRITKEYFNLDE